MCLYTRCRPRSCLLTALLLLRDMTNTLAQHRQALNEREMINQRWVVVFFAPRFRSSDFRVTFFLLCFSMRPVTLSFIPSPLLSSLQGFSVRSFEGEGGNFTLKRNGDGVETFSRGRRGVFYEMWPCSLTCCALLDS